MTREAFLNRVRKKWLVVAIHSNILHASSRHTRVEFVTVTSPADEILTKTSIQPLVQCLIFLVNGPVHYSYGGKFFPVNLSVYRRAV